jgi:hypothetical protein
MNALHPDLATDELPSIVDVLIQRLHAAVEAKSERDRRYFNHNPRRRFLVRRSFIEEVEIHRLTVSPIPPLSGQAFFTATLALMPTSLVRSLFCTGRDLDLDMNEATAAAWWSFSMNGQDDFAGAITSLLAETGYVETGCAQ